LLVKAKAKRRSPGVNVPVAAPSWTDAPASRESLRRLRPRVAGKA
jgi:hypothetical protein